ncbi:MAG TPA: PilZ domain-containing protein [Sphingomicrobium sp.]|nr:PilZ domain-containing protein [Sphingomicrobium sp.]
MKKPGIHKRSPRVDTKIEAVLIDADGNHIEVIVCDISRDGCRLKSPAMLEIGEQVRIQVPKYGDFPAQVRWSLGDEAGAVFLEPIHLPESDGPA